jgi:hypothetical protein
MKVLILFDVQGWAFEFVARGIAKYSKHECIFKRWTDVVAEDRNFDCLFCMNDSVWFALRRGQDYVRNITNKCVGIRGEEMPSDRILKGWKIGAVNKKIYDNLKVTPNLPIKGLFFTPNVVDTLIFKLTPRDDTKFIVGWAGNPTQPLKRYHLLNRIDFPLLVQSRWGPKFFVKERSRDEMVEFYSRINAFINVSVHEGMPQSILEAAATGLPIVVTNAGGMAEFVDPRWVVSASTESDIIRIMNEKLMELKLNIELRRNVGEANYGKVLKEWSWSTIVRYYDEMFES